MRVDVDFRKGHAVLVLKGRAPTRAGGLRYHRKPDGVPDVAFVDQVDGEANFGARAARLVGRRGFNLQPMNGGHGHSKRDRVVGRTAGGGEDTERQLHFFRGQRVDGHTYGHANVGGFLVAVSGANGHRGGVKLNGPTGGRNGGSDSEVVLTVALVGDGEGGGLVAAGLDVRENGIGDRNAGASGLTNDDAQVGLTLDGAVVAVFPDDLHDRFRTGGHRIVRRNDEIKRSLSFEFSLLGIENEKTNG
ncbi:MAG: hypothetical protein CMJ14_06240 [Pelagibacterales bacterium]|nr:hypothetical protein [Pelagibacterales bacterium]